MGEERRRAGGEEGGDLRRERGEEEWERRVGGQPDRPKKRDMERER